MPTAISKASITGCTDAHIHYLNDRVGVHKAMVDAFLKLQQAALAAGFNLKIASGYRSFDQQLAIFNGKLSGQRNVLDINNQKLNLADLKIQEKITSILLFSALPGASRHHWGTDIDVYDPDLLNDKPLQLESWEYEATGPQAPLTKWLDENMKDFGFYRPYDLYRGGVAAEPWHISYHPLASMYSSKLTLDLLRDCLATSEISNKTDLLAMLDIIYNQYIINVGTP
ncbi:M15 family metallopeptidase [Thalassotalea psychrophila]|uniref:M15 family metallopeptidase n=1 Tax=Thalassotalea psychrophila TaxID=3065647 RepID=A0ABY9TY86_9GAMM|nr:M15 family metallopeptidase [Colwelliaceae bacterium SQ149]